MLCSHINANKIQGCATVRQSREDVSSLSSLGRSSCKKMPKLISRRLRKRFATNLISRQICTGSLDPSSGFFLCKPVRFPACWPVYVNEEGPTVAEGFHPCEESYQGNAGEAKKTHEPKTVFWLHAFISFDCIP